MTCRDFPKWRACAQATSFLPVRSLILTGERWVVCDRILLRRCHWKYDRLSNWFHFTYIYNLDVFRKKNLSELKWTIFSNSFVSLSSNSRLWIIGVFFIDFCLFYSLFFHGPSVDYREIWNVTLNKKFYYYYYYYYYYYLLLLLPLQALDKIV